jgi:Domain of unknown function (DUF4338)/DDE_Tnp_1-associated/Transposase DDE domain
MQKQTQAQEPDVLKRVTIRLVREEERGEFDFRLEHQHYLGSAHLAGQTLRYVAEWEGEWVALVCFGAAALHLKAREQWMGWTPRQRARRLPFVVNNSRFLVLPERQRYPNLASRVLGLCLRRLSADWQERWGHPVLVVESFVDESRYRGTCYKACGFEAVGLTEGYGRSSRDFYQEHGQPKQLYLRELRPKARARLRHGRLPKELAQYEEKVAGPCPLLGPQLESLLDAFKVLHDRRSGHGLRHWQPFVLACAAVATLMGAGGYQGFEDLCRKLTQRQLRALGCRRNKEGRYVPPSDSTFFRVISQLDAALFERIMGSWLLQQEVSVLSRLAVDGKVLRGSGRNDGKPLQLLSAVTHRLRLTLGQIPIAEKSNEIPALKPLLKALPDLEGSLITADALHCQQESARFVTQEMGADYLFGLKGNQSGVLTQAGRLLSGQSFFPSGKGGRLGKGPSPA